MKLKILVNTSPLKRLLRVISALSVASLWLAVPVLAFLAFGPDFLLAQPLEKELTSQILQVDRPVFPISPKDMHGAEKVAPPNERLLLTLGNWEYTQSDTA